MEGRCNISWKGQAHRPVIRRECLFKKSLREVKTADCRGKEVLCKMISQKEVPISKGCASLEIKRRTYYYSLKRSGTDQSDKSIRSSIHKIALEKTSWYYTVTLFIDIGQLEFARKLLNDCNDAYDNAQLTFLSGVIYAKQKDYLAAKEEFQSIRKISKTAMEYFEKVKALADGTIKEHIYCSIICALCYKYLEQECGNQDETKNTIWWNQGCNWASIIRAPLSYRQEKP